ncbi:MAG: DUF6265 family protein [Bacteroidota bacterium]|jgi:Domain of unknown function (DUF6265)
MKKVFLAFLTFCVLSSYCQENSNQIIQNTQRPLFLTSLQGNWVGTTGRELWTPVEDEAVIEGISFFNVNFEDYGTNEMPEEHMVILNDGSQWIYLATPLDSEKSTTFFCTKSSDTEWVFENSENEFPKRIIYTLLASDQLQTRIDAGPDSSPKDVKIWKYWKKNL